MQLLINRCTKGKDQQQSAPDAVVESVKRGRPSREIGSSIPGRAKPMTDKIDKCRFLGWRLDKDWLAHLSG